MAGGTSLIRAFLPTSLSGWWPEDYAAAARVIRYLRAHRFVYVRAQEYCCCVCGCIHAHVHLRRCSCTVLRALGVRARANERSEGGDLSVRVEGSGRLMESLYFWDLLVLRRAESGGGWERLGGILAMQHPY